MTEYEKHRMSEKHEFVNWLLDERKAAKLRLAELEYSYARLDRLEKLEKKT